MNHSKLLTLGYHLMREPLKLTKFHFGITLIKKGEGIMGSCGSVGCGMGEAYLLGMFPDRPEFHNYIIIAMHAFNLTQNGAIELFAPCGQRIMPELHSNSTPQQVGRNIVDYVKQNLKYCED